MPRKDIHDYVERSMIGKVTHMSEEMDKYYATLGSHHREIAHSVDEITMLALRLEDNENSFEDNLTAGLIHIMLDEQVTGGGLPDAASFPIKKTTKKPVKYNYVCITCGNWFVTQTQGDTICFKCKKLGEK